jgi:5-methylcytosine-specific restriction enzyme subunit McrC
MNQFPSEQYVLEEFKPFYLPADQLPYELAEKLHYSYGKQIQVDFPSPHTGGQWRLTSQGWVGYIPLSEEVHFFLKPKVPIANLFQMLEYAYRLDIQFLVDLYQAQSLQSFYDRLASILARRIMDRARKGFYRKYVDYCEETAYVRGRVNFGQLIRSPWKINMECEVQEHSPDIIDNQILAWTLYTIARSGSCSEKTLSYVRKAYHELESSVTLQSFRPQVCLGRFYHRLNEDYQPLHALCRFFLEQSGPNHQVGDHTMIPFLVDMARLFELFVAEWLKNHLPYPYAVKVQERIYLSDDRIKFQVDLIIQDQHTGQSIYVLDTKYKKDLTPSTSDISQVVAYAEALQCDKAALVYPRFLSHRTKIQVGQIQVHSLCFELDKDLDAAGKYFLQQLW